MRETELKACEFTAQGRGMIFDALPNLDVTDPALLKKLKKLSREPALYSILPSQPSF